MGEEELKKLPGGSLWTATADLLSDLSGAENQKPEEERLNRILQASENAAATTEELREYIRVIGGLAVVMFSQQQQVFQFLQEGVTTNGIFSMEAEEVKVQAKAFALEAYRHSVLCEFEKVDRRGVGDSKKQQHMALLPLDAVYVEPNLLQERDIAHSREQDVSKRLAEEADYLAHDEKRSLEDELDRLLGQRWRRGRMAPTTATLLKQVLPSLRQAVILGGPGSGKSTLVRYVARMCTRGEIAGLHGFTPVVVSLASYAGARKDAPSLTLRDYLLRLARERGGDVLAEAITDELGNGRLFVLLDGVDEVAEESLRRAVVQAVEAFLQNEAKPRVLVTSRPIGYMQISGGLPHYTLPPFTPEQMSSFVYQWHAAVAPLIELSPDKAKQEAETMLAEIKSNPQVSELATNPLMLVILTLLRSEGTKLPERRVQLYERVVKLLVDTWNELRRLDPVTTHLGSELNTEHFIRVLAAVAH